jgi:hypothetical protein
LSPATGNSSDNDARRFGQHPEKRDRMRRSGTAIVVSDLVIDEGK